MSAHVRTPSSMEQPAAFVNYAPDQAAPATLEAYPLYQAEITTDAIPTQDEEPAPPITAPALEPTPANDAKEREILAEIAEKGTE